MGTLLQLWWAWAVFGFGLGVLELFAPGYVFLGFALGALGMAALLGLGVKVSTGVLIFLFALFSVVAWFALRNLFGRGGRDVKRIDHDINEN